MPKSIVLFVCKYDPFGLGFPVYTFSNLCHEKTTLELEDECSKIFVNTKGNKEGLRPELAAFLEYVDTDVASDELTSKLAQEVTTLYNDDEVRNSIMTLEQDRIEEVERAEARGIERGIAQGKELGKELGIKQGKLEAARQMKADGLAVEKIMKYTGLSKKEVEEA